MKGFYGISYNSYSNTIDTNKIFPKGLKKEYLIKRSGTQDTKNVD